MDKANLSAQQALSNLDPVRQELQKQKNPEQNMLLLNKGLDSLKESLKDQLVNVKAMKNIKKDIEKEGTAAATKLQLESFLEVIERDILSLLNLAKLRMIAPKNEKRTQDLSSTLREEAFWKLVEDKYRDKINEIKLNIDSKNNYFEIIFKYLNIRDALIIQNIKALLYQQQILCKDLNIPSNEYVHNEIYKILFNMEQQQEKSGYISSKSAFDTQFVKLYKTFKVEDSVNDSNAKSLAISQYMDLAGKSFDHSESLLRNIFGLTNIDKEIAINNSKVVTSFLRDELHAAHNTIAELGQKISYLNSKIRSDTRTDDDDEVLRKEIQQKDTLVQDLQRDVKVLNTELSKTEKSNQMMKYHYNQLQDTYQKLSGTYFPKLEETTEQLKKTTDEVEKIRKEVEFFSTMFRAEKREKKAVETERKQLEDKMQKIADVLGQFRNKNKFLKEEVSQKDLMCFELAKAIDESRNKVVQMEKEIEALKKECRASKERESKALKEQDFLQKLVFALQTQLKKDNRSEGLDDMVSTIFEERRIENEAKLQTAEAKDKADNKYELRNRAGTF